MKNLILGDCLHVLKQIESNSIDAIVTDPPYGLSFMGKRWDYDVPTLEVWAECLRVLKPGGHLLAFAGTRTQHRMAVRIEDAGFEIRDMLAWVYGSGFPKSLDVSKAIDKLDATEARRERQLRFTAWMCASGCTRETAAMSILGLVKNKETAAACAQHYFTDKTQPAVAARDHFEMMRPHFTVPVPAWVEEMVDQRTVESENFKRREVVGQRTTGIGTGGGSTPIMGDGNRDVTTAHTPAARRWEGWGTALKPALEPITVARKPFRGTVAENVLEHGTGALNIGGCRVGDDTRVNNRGGRRAGTVTGGSYVGGMSGDRGYSFGEAGPQTVSGRWPANLIHDGSDDVVDVLGESSRFFYCAKASKKDRGPDNRHPTVKPTDLMAYLCKLITPPGGTVLDPFMGSGSTGKAAVLEGFHFVGIELDPNYMKIAQARIEKVEG